MSLTPTLPISSPESIPQISAVLKKGGLVAFPTDTVYGLAVPFNSQAGIDRLFEVKGRDFNKAIAVLVGSLEQTALLTSGFSEMAKKLAAAYWPGALTLIVKIKTGLPPNLSPYPTIGIRMPNHPFVLSLLQQTGPLATTSANISGGANTITAAEVLQQLDGKMDLLIDGGKTPGAVPSTVVDCTETEPLVIRQGSITKEDLLKVLS